MPQVGLWVPHPWFLKGAGLDATNHTPTEDLDPTALYPRSLPRSRGL